jgi:hypothetical protein
MRFLSLFVFFMLLPAPASSQEAVAPSGQEDSAGNAPSPAVSASTAPPSNPDWRSTEGYPYPAIATTVAAAQNMAHAMILRDYCANPKIADDFVRERLKLFGRITGREETCQSLLDY